MTAKLVEAHELAPDVRHFVFEVCDTAQFSFIPGQFVSLSAILDGKKITRAYSIASPPDGNRFALCLNRVEGGIFSPYLFELHPGDTVDVSPPLGYFVLRNPDRDRIFVATGTGVAPFRALLLSFLGQADTHQTTLVFGVRHERNLLYRSEFEELESRYPNFRFWPTLSRPDPDWKGRTGHVQPHVLEAIGQRRDLDVYICGLKLMVDDMRAILKALGFDRKQIIFEKYD